MISVVVSVGKKPLRVSHINNRHTTMAEETTGEPVIEEVINISVFTPIIYLTLLVGVFLTFSFIYKRRRLEKLTTFEPIFPENEAANLYEFLKEQYTSDDVPKENRPHEKVMKAALLRRACEAIRRSMKLKENEPVFNKLYQDGLIGDDMLKQYEIQVKFQEIELKEIVAECESYKKGWVQTFFPTAQEICFNEALRRRLYAMDDRSKTLSQLWQYHVEKSEKMLQDKKKGQDKSTEKSGELVKAASKEITPVAEEDDLDDSQPNDDNVDSKSKKKKKSKAKK